MKLRTGTAAALVLAAFIYPFGFAIHSYAATVYPTASSDTLNTFRTNVNSSLTNLNTDRVGTSTTPTQGQLPYWTSPTALGAVATSAPVQGTGITLSGTGAVVGGSLTITNSGVTSIAGTANQINASGATGALTLSLSSHVVLASILATIASSTHATTTGSQYITPLATPAGAFLAIDPDGRVISTTTPTTGTTGQVGYFFGTNVLRGTSALYIDASARIGVGSTSPHARLSVHANANDAALPTTLFAVASSTAVATTTHFSVSNTGTTTATSLTVTSSLQVPNGTNPTADDVGELAWDTSPGGNLKLATSTTGHVVIASATSTLYSFTASTSALTSGSVIDLPSHDLAQVATAIWCKVTSGTSFALNLSDDGTSDTNTVTCTTTGAQYALTTNNSFTAYEPVRVELGTKTGDTGNLVIRIYGYRTSN